MAEHPIRTTAWSPPVQLLNVPEVAEELRISETAVYRLIKSGDLAAVKAGARRRVVSREALDDFIRRGGINGDS